MLEMGVDYYPEHWDTALWEKDAELMEKTGIKLVRIGEFAWCKLEPSEGKFDFAWMDEAVETLSRHGIGVIIGTPTNCPPLWAYEKYPDIKQHSRNGTPNAHGIRGNRCYNSPAMRRLTENIVRALAQRYSGNSAVVGWQIDNELEAVECCCPVCQERFREYLREKYQSLDNINSVYGNIMWGGEYSSWEQVIPPMGEYNETWFNTAFITDWRDFCKKSVNGFAEFQAGIIREYMPDTIITTNTWLCEQVCDMYELFSGLDVVAYDNYPTTRLPEDKNAIYSHAFHLDMMRGVKRKNFWIMEQLSGTPGCWMPMQPTTVPGMLGGYIMQAFAHGADKVLNFRWRSAAKGAEMYWHGLIDHCNVPSRRFFEYQETSERIRELSIPADAVIKNDVAIIMSFEQEAALRLQPQSDGFNYYEQLKKYHDGITALGCGCDVISEHEDISGYKVVVAPALFMNFSDTVKKLHDFAKNGGTVVLSSRSGVKDEHDNCIMERIPCGYTDMTGCAVSEYDPIGRGNARICMKRREYEVSLWCDIIENETAEAVAEYSDRFYAGTPCVLKNKYGEGNVYYVGVTGGRDFYRDLLAEILGTAGVGYVADLPRNMEITRRESSDSVYTFVFNNNETPTKIDIPEMKAELKAFECRVVKREL